MFAPVVNRFEAYCLNVSDEARAYMASVKALSSWRQWELDALKESWTLDLFNV